jgi:ABC-2 type transport system ATP-binding protein
VIDVRELSKRYGETVALENVSLTIGAGGVVGLLGPNGAGKTTLVETLEGLHAPTSGSVSVLGFNPSRQARALRERIGVQLQHTALPQELTPFETLRLFGAFFRKSLPPAQVLEHVQLADRATVRNDRLSAGQRQRLAIGLALINDPDLVILDEPTEGLDVAARREIHTYIAEFRRSGRTVLLTTHYLEEAERLCDRVILLRAGHVIADGRPTDLAAASGPTTLEIVLRGGVDPEPLLAAGAVVTPSDGQDLRFTTDDPRAGLTALGRLLHDRAVALVDVRLRRPTLEDVYLRLMADSSGADDEATS